MDLKWSGFISPYTEETVRKIVPEAPGIYLLWCECGEGYKCFYAGRAVNLRQKLLGHLLCTESNVGIWHRVKDNGGFHYAEVPETSDRKGIRIFLYKNLLPECNIHIPSGTEIEVNLPDFPGL